MPDLTPFGRGRGLFEGIRTIEGFGRLGQQNIQAEKQTLIEAALAGQPISEQQQQLASQSLGLGEDTAVKPRLTQEQMMAEALKIDPAMARQQFKARGFDTAAKRAEASSFAAKLLSLPSRLRESKIMERAQDLQAQNRDPADTLELLDMSEAEQGEALQGIQLLDLATKERLSFQERRGVTTAKRKTKEETDLLKSELKATEETFDRASKIRSEIAKASVDFNKQEGAWIRVQASAEDPSPAGDLALIFNFMKVLDPGSTVREGEFAQVGAAGNLPTQAQRMYEQWATGQKLTVEQRKDVTGRAKKLFTAASALNKRNIAKFISIGKQFGVKRENLLGAEKQESAQVIKFNKQGQRI